MKSVRETLHKLPAIPITQKYETTFGLRAFAHEINKMYQTNKYSKFFYIY